MTADQMSPAVSSWMPILERPTGVPREGAVPSHSVMRQSQRQSPAMSAFFGTRRSLMPVDEQRLGHRLRSGMHGATASSSCLSRILLRRFSLLALTEDRPCGLETAVAEQTDRRLARPDAAKGTEDSARKPQERTSSREAGRVSAVERLSNRLSN